MPTDYAKRPSKPSGSRKPRTNKRRKTPASKTAKAPLWAWVVIALLLGALLTLLIFLLNQSQARRVPAEPAALSSPTPKPKSGPKLEFYEILKEREVAVPDRSAEVEAANPNNVALYLQVASFRSQQAADQLRATLLLQNLPAFIESVDADSGRWYRVMAGPFASRSKMAKARSELAAQQLSARVIRRPLNEP